MPRPIPNPPQRRHWLGRLLRALVIGALAWLTLSWLLVLLLRFVPPWTSAVMLEQQTSAWLRGDTDFHLRHHWVPWRQISPYVPLAMVAGEDQQFPYHHGFDFAAIHSAIDAADDGQRLRGASTISQQTAKNLFLWNGRSFVRKGLEAYFTALIELTWPKQRILEVYVNIAELGHGIYGVGAASDAYFHTSPARLGPAQAARLAAVLPSPRRLHADRPSAYVQRRANWIQRQMNQLGGPAYIEGHAPARPRR
jgi:monofunctional biosynthetic peptidoglycan transglycosylase